MGAAEIEGFLTHLAVKRTVAASTQNQAFAAILFLYQKVLQIEVPNINALRARRPEWLAVVLAVRVARNKKEQPPTPRIYYGTHPPECRMPSENMNGVGCHDYKPSCLPRRATNFAASQSSPFKFRNLDPELRFGAV